MNKINLTFRKKFLLEIYRKYIQSQTRLHELTYLFWECTTRCNIACLHCGSDCRKDIKGSKDMPSDDFLKVVSAVKTKFDSKKVMIVITGGEPLLRKDLEKIGTKLHYMGFPWGMVSNGYALTRERLHELIKAGLHSITISLDGLEINHDWLRGVKGSFQKALAAIQEIVKCNGLTYDVVTCVNQRNFQELGRIRELLLKHNVQHWRVFTIFPIGRAKENPAFVLTDFQFKQLMDFIVESRKQYNLHMSYGCEGFLGNYEGQVRDGFYFCHAGINIASILADGSISACPNINHAFIQGNIYKDDFLDVWENRFQIMRDRNWTKKGICKECNVYKYCKGNGMHLHEPDREDVLRCHYKMLK